MDADIATHILPLENRPDGWNSVRGWLKEQVKQKKSGQLLATSRTSRVGVGPLMQAVETTGEDDDDKMTIKKIAEFGIAGIIAISVAESVFWVLSFPTSELLFYLSTGEWIDLTQQDGQVKFLAFTAGWGALGGAIAQYRTVITAAAMTPWIDKNVVKPYINPLLEKAGKDPEQLNAGEEVVGVVQSSKMPDKELPERVPVDPEVLLKSQVQDENGRTVALADMLPKSSRELPFGIGATSGIVIFLRHLG
jgi:hypothetical protein